MYTHIRVVYITDILNYVSLPFHHWIAISVKLKIWFFLPRTILKTRSVKRICLFFIKLMRRERQSLVIGFAKFQFRYKSIKKTSGMRVFLNMIAISELFISFIVVEN